MNIKDSLPINYGSIFQKFENVEPDNIGITIPIFGRIQYVKH